MNEDMIRVEIMDSSTMMACDDGQLRDGKGNKNDEC